MSSREKPSAVCVRSLVPKEKKSASRAIRSAMKQARGSSIIVPTRKSARSSSPRSADRSTSVAHELELALVGDQRDHDLELRGAARRSRTASAARTIASHLHLVDLGEDDAQPHAARPQHRVGLLELAHAIERRARARRGRRAARSRAARAPRRARRGRAGTRAAAGRAAGSSPAARHRLEQALEVAPAGAAAARPARRAASLVVGHDHRLHLGWRSAAMNMCSVRHRPMPSAPNSRARARVLGRVGVRAHAEPAQLVGPAAAPSRSARRLRARRAARRRW